jgi:tRNA-dihydrouridine synthase
MTAMTLLRDIDRFNKRTGLAVTTLGRRAMGDPSFVAQLRAGRQTWPATEKKVRAWMAEYEAALPETLEAQAA